MKRKTAEEIHELMVGIANELQESIVKVRERENDEEYQKYVNSVAHILTIQFDILDSIYDRYPNLKPESYHREMPDD